MKNISLNNPAYGLEQAFARYLAPALNSPKRIGPKKILNAMRAEFERRIRRENVKSLPFVMHFDPTNICNLRCPECQTGSGKFPLPKGCLSFVDYKKVIDEIRDYLILIRLDGSGEAFLNPDIFTMIEYATKNRIISAMSTNFSTIKKDDAQKIVRSGLDYLIVAIDGATKETYEKIRVGSNFETVINNVKEVVSLKRSLASKTPFIEIQFIIFDNNAHEIEAMKHLARELSVDRLLVKEARKDALKKVQKRKKGGIPCYWLWYALNVAWNGELKTCCLKGLVSPFSFGNIVKRPLAEEWNGEKIRALRRMYQAKKTGETPAIPVECECLACYKIPL